MSKEESDSLNQRGAQLYDEGQYKKARPFFEDAVFLDPHNPHAYNNLGLCLAREGNFPLAIENFLKAVKYHPDFKDAHINLGNAYYIIRDFPNAKLHYEKAGSALDRYPKNYMNLGEIYLLYGWPDKAEKSYRKALKADKTNAEILNNLGVSLSRQGKQKEARAFYKKAIGLNPKNQDPYFNSGIAYARDEDYENAVIWFKKAYKVNPKHPPTLAYLVNRLPSICEWENRERLGKELDKVTDEQLAKGELPAEQPFMNNIRQQNPKRNLQIAKAYSKIKALEVAAQRVDLNFRYKPYKGGKIRVGYASNGFRDFPTGHNIIRLIELHNKKKFEVYLYSFGKNDGSIWRKRAEVAATEFRDITKLNFVQAAKLINRDQIDILVDLKGYTAENRIDIMALKPAPYIVSLLGFVGSTGASFIDYMVVDRTVVPKAHEKYYTEKLMFMPDIYWPTDNKAKISPIRFKRRDFGLPEKGFVFVCFNNCYKLEPEVFDIWLTLLKKIPGSVLWLIAQNQTQLNNLKNYTAKHGVDPNRVLFSGNVPKDQHLARLKLADLALDTITVNGHTTTTDCLWVGVPVVTVLGKHFASRVSASMLKAVGMNELITKTLKDYKKLIANLAKNPKRLERLKIKLAKNLKTSPLFDSERYTKNLESIYIEIVKTGPTRLRTKQFIAS